jgi:type I restriction enzyme S subunit
MGEIGTLFGGLTGKSKNDFTGGNARFVSYMNVFSNLATNVFPDEMVMISATENQREIHLGDILFTGSSESMAECGMSSVVTKQPAERLYLNSFCIGY